MSDITTLAVQKATKPKIEDVMPHYLDGDTLKSALDFIAYLRESKTNPSWAVHNKWSASNKGKVLCQIRLPAHQGHFQRPNVSDWKRSWCVSPYLSNLAKYEHLITDDYDKRLVAENLYGCVPHCRGIKCSTHNPEIKRTVCGTEISRYCHAGMLGNNTLWIVNPDQAEIASIKKLMKLEKQARADKI